MPSTCSFSLAPFASFEPWYSSTADVGRTCSDGICCSSVTRASAKPTERNSSRVLLAMLRSGSTAIDRIGARPAVVDKSALLICPRCARKMATSTTSAAAVVTPTRTHAGRRMVRPSDVREVVWVMRTVGVSISSRSDSRSRAVW
jgi:hypothetical protein